MNNRWGKKKQLRMIVSASGVLDGWTMAGKWGSGISRPLTQTVTFKRRWLHGDGRGRGSYSSGRLTPGNLVLEQKERIQVWPEGGSSWNYIDGLFWVRNANTSLCECVPWTHTHTHTHNKAQRSSVSSRWFREGFWAIDHSGRLLKSIDTPQSDAFKKQRI